MPLPVPNPAPNQHMVGSNAMALRWPVNKNRTVPQTAVANGAGSTTTIVCANGQGPTIIIGDKVRLFVAANTLKEATLFTITNKVVAGSTTYTFAPAAGGATASGDYISKTADISDITLPGNYLDIAAMDARLTAINAGVYTQARLNSMTVNDKLYAIRLNDDAEMVG